MFSGNPSGAQLSSVAMLDVLTVQNAKKMLTAVDGALVESIWSGQTLVQPCLVWNMLLTTCPTLLKTHKKQGHVSKMQILRGKQQI